MLGVCLSCNRFFDLTDETCNTCETRAQALRDLAAEKAAEANGRAQWTSKANGIPLTANASDSFGRVTFRFPDGLCEGTVYGTKEQDGERYLRVWCASVAQWRLVQPHQIRDWQE